MSQVPGEYLNKETNRLKTGYVFAFLAMPMFTFRSLENINRDFPFNKTKQIKNKKINVQTRIESHCRVKLSSRLYTIYFILSFQGKQ